MDTCLYVYFVAKREWGNWKNTGTHIMIDPRSYDKHIKLRYGLQPVVFPLQEAHNTFKYLFDLLSQEY